MNYERGPIPCRYCHQTIRRYRDQSEAWLDYEGKYYCLSFEHGLLHEPVDNPL